MANPSSNFLRGANAAGSEGSNPLPDETAVLLAVSKLQSKGANLTTIAVDLQTSPTAVVEIVDQLTRSGLVENRAGNLKLSAAGERAVRYASVAKF